MRDLLTSPAFWRGFRRGWIQGSLIGLPLWLAFVIWWWFS